MWCKLIAGIFVIIGAEGLGLAYCQDMKCKLSHQIKQKQMLLYIEKEIDFLHRPMIEIFDSISERVAKPYDFFLIETAETMKKDRGISLHNAWYENINNLLDSKDIKKEYIDYLYRIGDCFGCEEDELQISMIKLIKDDLEEDIVKTKESINEKEKLVKTLSLLAGIFCVVMFM